MVLNVKILRTHWETLIGLIGADSAYSVYFTTRWGIHTFGMKSPIDILVLDSTMRVMKLTRSLPPHRIYLWNPIYFHVIELPEGEIMKKRIAINTPITLRTYPGRMDRLVRSMA